VDDVWLPAETLQCLEHAAAEENEPFVVVFIIFPTDRTLVNTVSAEIVGVVEEVDLDFFFQVADEGRLDVALLDNLADRYRDFFEADNVWSLNRRSLMNDIGHHDPDFVPQFFDSLRKRARNVAKPPVFAKGSTSLDKNKTFSGLDIELQSQKIDENQVNLANFRQRSN